MHQQALNYHLRYLHVNTRPCRRETELALHDPDSINLVKPIEGVTVYSTKESALDCCSALNVLVLLYYFTNMLVNILHICLYMPEHIYRDTKLSLKFIYITEFVKYQYSNVKNIRKKKRICWNITSKRNLYDNSIISSINHSSLNKAMAYNCISLI